MPISEDIMSGVSSIELGRSRQAADRATTTATRLVYSEGPSQTETVLELLSTLAGIVGVMLIVLAVVRLIV